MFRRRPAEPPTPRETDEARAERLEREAEHRAARRRWEDQRDAAPHIVQALSDIAASLRLGAIACDLRGLTATRDSLHHAEESAARALRMAKGEFRKRPFMVRRKGTETWNRWCYAYTPDDAAALYAFTVGHTPVLFPWAVEVKLDEEQWRKDEAERAKGATDV